MKTLIANEEKTLANDAGKISITIYGGVFDEANTESRDIYISYYGNVDTALTEVLGYTELRALVTSAVAGVNGHADVTLPTALAAITYSTTSAFDDNRVAKLRGEYYVVEEVEEEVAP